MRLLLLFLTVNFAADAAGDNQQRLHEITLGSLPMSVVVGDRSVTVRDVADPAISALAGSGGPMVRIEVDQLNAPQGVIVHVQAIALAVLASEDVLPRFEVWTGSGVGRYVRSTLAWRGGGYCYLETEDYEQPLDDAEDARAIRLPGDSARAIFRRRGTAGDCPTATP